MMGPGYNSNNGSGIQGLQCPIGLVEQNWLEMSLNGEFPEHIPHCSKAGLASSPTIMPSSHTTQSLGTTILPVTFNISSFLIDIYAKCKRDDGFSTRSGIGYPTGRKDRKKVT